MQHRLGREVRKRLGPIEVESVGARAAPALETGFERRKRAARDVSEARDQEPLHRTHFMHTVTVQPAGQSFQVEQGE